MTDHRGNIADEQSIDVEVRKPLSAVFSVRFGATELQLLRREAELQGISVGQLIKNAVRPYVAAHLALREQTQNIAMGRGAYYLGFGGYTVSGSDFEGFEQEADRVDVTLPLGSA